MPDPVPPPLTPAEAAHLASLQKLLQSLSAAEADHSNSAEARDALVDQIDGVGDQIRDVEAGVYSRTTVDLHAVEDSLGSAIDQLKALQKDLKKIGTGIKTAGTIASAVTQAISTAESLLA
jgi:hypothetical protein